MLEDFGIDYEMNVISAHREPDVFVEYAKLQKIEALMLLLQVLVEQRIFRECVQRSSHFRSSAFRFIQNHSVE